MRVVYTVFTVFTTVFTYEGLYTVFTIVLRINTNGICANLSCAHYFAHVGFAQMGFAPSCPTRLKEQGIYMCRIKTTQHN